MKVNKEKEVGVWVTAQAATTAASQSDVLAPTAESVEPGAPTCPRRRWMSWRQDQPPSEQEQVPCRVWCRWLHWHRDGTEDDVVPREWTPTETMRWRERRWNGCQWRGRRAGAGAEARVQLDDSRWLEDFFSWY